MKSMLGYRFTKATSVSTMYISIFSQVLHINYATDLQEVLVDYRVS